MLANQLGNWSARTDNISVEINEILGASSKKLFLKKFGAKKYVPLAVFYFQCVKKSVKPCNPELSMLVTEVFKANMVRFLCGCYGE